jgi:sulfur-oxidizing protein SoxY
MKKPSRRELLAWGSGAAATVVMAGQSSSTSAAPADAAAAIAKFTGGKAATRGKITIDLPEIAEDGTTVPLSVKVDSPMSAHDRITEILVVADENPRPVTATFHFTEMSGRAVVSTRMRLAATENVIVVAKTNDGKFFTEQKPVKVTIGGCGG